MATQQELDKAYMKMAVEWGKLSKAQRSLDLHDPNAVITVGKEHLEAINYLLGANIRHEKDSPEEHNTHLKNARDVIEKALKADPPNQPCNLFARVAVPDDQC
tara:strand:- start:363 stop:671 length:309 start_codon:yes stop_codon:yes gene_type:complete